jgi:hypothetical protein
MPPYVFIKPPRFTEVNQNKKTNHNNKVIKEMAARTLEQDQYPNRDQAALADQQESAWYIDIVYGHNILSTLSTYYTSGVNRSIRILLVNSLIAAMVLLFFISVLSISLLLTMMLLRSSQTESIMIVLTIAALIPAGLTVIFSLKVLGRTYDRLYCLLLKQSLDTKDHF